MAEFETAQFFFKNKTRHLLKHVMKCMRDIDAPMHHVYFLTLRKYIHVYIISISTQQETRNNLPLLLPVFLLQNKILKSLYHIALKYVTTWCPKI